MNFTERQKKIVSAAFELAREKGAKGLTTAEIAAKVGVTEPALYRHFNDKSAMLSAVLDTMKEINRSNRAAVAQKRKRVFDRLEAMYMSTAQNLATNPVLAGVMYSEDYFVEDKILRKKVLEIQDETLKTVAGILKEGMKTGEIAKKVRADDAALMIVGTVRIVIARWRLSGYADDISRNIGHVIRGFGKLLVSTH